MASLLEKRPRSDEGWSRTEPTLTRRKRPVAVIAAVALCAGGLGAGLALTFDDSPAQSATANPIQSAGAPRLASPTATAKRLVTKFFTLVEQKNSSGLKTFLSPAFQVERADGSGTTGKSAYLANLPTITGFHLSAMSATQDGSVLVARYLATTTTGSVNGKPYTPGPAPRLSVFVWNGSAWHVVAHANFNPLNG